jgi:hypothetical protein
MKNVQIIIGKLYRQPLTPKESMWHHTMEQLVIHCKQNKAGGSKYE